MADQAKVCRCSVSYISAIERGEREIPPDFADLFASWVQLTDGETRQLRDLASRKNKRSIVVTPADSEREAVTDQFARTINSISRERLQKVRSLLNDVDPSVGFSNGDLRKLAACARACFEIGNQLTFDLIDILENKLPQIDPEFFLQVNHDHSLQSQIAGYAEAMKSAVKKIVLSEYIYDGAHQQKADPRFITGHEIGHWLLNQAGNFQSYPSILQIEKDIDRFTREFLMPHDIVERFGTPRQLAFACNVPVEQAEFRMSELGLWPPQQKRDQIAKGFSELLSTLKKEPRKEASSARLPEFRLIPFPNAPVRQRAAAPSSIQRRKKTASASLPLFEFAELSNKQVRSDYYGMLDALSHLSRAHEDSDVTSPTLPVHTEYQYPTLNRALEWFRLFGWR
jgi:Zn-dependent peptidase ImmA (M78 family)